MEVAAIMNEHTASGRPCLEQSFELKGHENGAFVDETSGKWSWTDHKGKVNIHFMTLECNQTR